MIIGISSDRLDAQPEIFISSCRRIKVDNYFVNPIKGPSHLFFITFSTYSTSIIPHLTSFVGGKGRIRSTFPSHISDFPLATAGPAAEQIGLESKRDRFLTRYATFCKHNNRLVHERMSNSMENSGRLYDTCMSSIVDPVTRRLLSLFSSTLILIYSPGTNAFLGSVKTKPMGPLLQQKQHTSLLRSSCTACSTPGSLFKSRMPLTVKGSFSLRSDVPDCCITAFS